MDAVSLKLRSLSLAAAVWLAFVPGTSRAMESAPGARRTASIQASWPKFRFDVQNRGSNPFETVLGPGNVSQLTQKWSFATGGPISGSATVVDGVAYFGSWDGKVYAVDAASGQIVWSTPPTGDIIKCTPTVVGGWCTSGRSTTLSTPWIGAPAAPSGRSLRTVTSN